MKRKITVEVKTNFGNDPSIAEAPWRVKWRIAHGTKYRDFASLDNAVRFSRSLGDLLIAIIYRKNGEDL